MNFTIYNICAPVKTLVEACSYEVHVPIQPLDGLARRANYESDYSSYSECNVRV
jgi:hypothetical protein